MNSSDYAFVILLTATMYMHKWYMFSLKYIAYNNKHVNY